MIVRLVQHMLLLYNGITASTRAIAVWAPFYPICIYAVPLCFYILSTFPFPQAATKESPKFVCLHFVQTYRLLHFCFTLNRSCGPAGHSLTWLVNSCLTHLAECESP